MSEFDENYFHTEAYAEVSFEKYSQYWWSNRFYALLARKHGPKGGRVLEVGCGLGHLMAFLPTTTKSTGGILMNMPCKKRGAWHPKRISPLSPPKT